MEIYIFLFLQVFFVLRKKNNQITFLHVTHHASLPIIVWVIFRTDHSKGLQCFLFDKIRKYVL